MNSDKIRFRCPSCDTQLDVPAQLAGVSGPCPSCQNTITAPHPTVEIEPEPPAQAPAIEQAPPPQQRPTPAPIPPAPRQVPARSHARQNQEQAAERLAAQAAQLERATAAQAVQAASPPPVQRGQSAFPDAVKVPPPAEPQSPIPAAVAAAVAKEPAQVQVRSTPHDHGFSVEEGHAGLGLGKMKRISPEMTGSADQPRPLPKSSSAPAPHPAERRSRIPSILFLVAVFAIVGALITLILSTTGIVGLGSFSSLLKSIPAEEGSNPQTTNEKLPPADSLADPTPLITPEANQVSKDGQIDEGTFIEEGSASPKPQTLGEPELPPGEDFRQGETPLPGEIDGDPMVEAEKVREALVGFFAAKNLTERSSTLSTTTLSMPGIEKSLLAGKIPEPLKIQFLDIYRDADENRRDFFFVVGWDGSRNSPSRPITVELHRWHPNENPRLHAEAFLEAYEGALTRYASNPKKKPARFHVMARCVQRYFGEIELPDSSNIVTLKLASFPGDYDTVDCYFPKKSELLEQLRSGMKGAAMRQEIPMTVTLDWSKTEPPYLQLARIDSFDWHP